MGAKDTWNHDALFDYTDRYIEIGNYLQGNIALPMWKAYRNNYGCTWTRDNSADTYSAGHYNCASQMVRCSWQKSTVGTLATLCSQYPNQRACNYDPCNLGCNGNCGSLPSQSASPSVFSQVWNFVRGVLTGDTIKEIIGYFLRLR
jgi:hypothetical protein